MSVADEGILLRIPLNGVSDKGREALGRKEDGGGSRVAATRQGQARSLPTELSTDRVIM